ncbi:uncharacterized protein LOC110021004 isoform X2 [Phalaenopsis equestris]|uniref:uncharacterized protein LOC110021004 isoform X2 n=1 Tax=Phalaenopsis equestris TaxID=78828 RepID=UPI0009E591C3|nr:uncharacterized protein LOC110021004 isoform X2 [Phalaenopsis equestris]
MDAAELRLPVNVTVDKRMESDDLDRVGEIEARSSTGKEASASHKGSGTGSCRTESSRNKKDEDSCVHGNLPSHPLLGENTKGHDFEKVDGHASLSQNQEGKLLGRKYSKRPVSIPSKRSRIDDVESCMNEFGTGSHRSISGKAGLDPIRCTLADKSQIVKLKRVHDGRKTDKKVFRASVKNKYESLTSKVNLACSDTFSGGSNILGTHGSKLDLQDIARNLDEISLCELLDGSYKFGKLPMDKGKKCSNSNDSILLSVRKACSILCPRSQIAENGSNVKASQSSQDPSFSTGSSSDCEAKEKQLEELLTKSKDQDSLHANWSESTVLQPKNLLEQLGLPAAHELEAYMFNPNTSSVPAQLTPKDKNCNYIGIPPFPWSVSHGGNGKPSVDFCKANSSRNSCQSKWARIVGSSTSTHGHNLDSLNQQKIDDFLEVIRSFTPSLQPPSDGPSNKSAVLGTQPEVEVVEILNSVLESGSFNSKADQPVEVTPSFNGTYLGSDSKDNGSAVVSRCEMRLDYSKFNLLLKDKDKAVMMESRTVTIDDSSVSNVNTGSNCSTWRSLNWEKYRQVYSSELLSAAETLLEMAYSSESMTATKHSNGRLRWPKTPSMKTMKARKSSTSLDKPDRSFRSPVHNDPIKQSNTPSAKHQPTSERKTNFIRPCSSGRETVRWSSIPMSAASSPHKLGKDLNLRSPHGNSTFRPLLAPFSSRADKTYDNQIRKAPAKPPSVAFEGSSIRDWIRGRNKRI